VIGFCCSRPCGRRWSGSTAKPNRSGFHNVPEHLLVQRMTILVVPMLQSTVAIAIGLLLQVG
jgi:hypothetical protein